MRGGLRAGRGARTGGFEPFQRSSEEGGGEYEEHRPTPPKETFLKHLLSSESSQSKAMFANPGVHAQVMGVPFRIFSKLTISFSKSTGAP